MKATRIGCPVILVLVALVGLPLLAGAASDTEAPTFYRDVLPILQDNCQTCHRPSGENIGGMIAPMSLMTYQEVRPWVKSIARAVGSRQMPPWFASDDTRGQFHHERVLSEEAIATVLRWSARGAPAGEVADAPAPMKFVEEGSGGWSLGRPDLVVSLPKPFLVEDDVRDLNINFSTVLTPEQLPEDTWVQGIEFKVGGRGVHHMCASAEPPGEEASFGKFTRHALGCIALGAEAQMMPEGYGMLLRPGSTIRFSMHYHKEPGEGSAFTDQSQIGFIFNKTPVHHRVRYEPVGNLRFEIPPGQSRWRVGAGRTFQDDTTLLALWPHAHLRAVAARYEAIYPDGTRELLLDVPQYDQEWQTTYQYIVPKQIPGGTRLEVSIWYDNTAERGEERGFDSARAVPFGIATTDEMMLGFINYAPTQPEEPGATPQEIPSAGGGS